MPHYHKPGLLLLVTISWLLWCGSSFAQVEMLSDEEYRQEARTYMLNPCFEEAGQTMIKSMDLEGQQLSGAELFRVLALDKSKSKEAENELIDNVLEKVTGKPKNERMIWYKAGASVCVKAFKNVALKNGFFPGMTKSLNTLEPKHEPDDSINEKPSHSDTHVSAQTKRDVVKRCKESVQRVGSSMRYSMLNTCIESELEAYQEFQRNYGN